MFLQPTDVILASGRQYQLHYDEATGSLTGVTTPTLAEHRFSRVSSLGVDRLVYRPPSSARSAAAPAYTQYRDSAGRIVQVNSTTLKTILLVLRIVTFSAFTTVGSDVSRPK